jgi:hypothetical protein
MQPKQQYRLPGVLNRRQAFKTNRGEPSRGRQRGGRQRGGRQRGGRWSTDCAGSSSVETDCDSETASQSLRPTALPKETVDEEESEDETEDEDEDEESEEETPVPNPQPASAGASQKRLPMPPPVLAEPSVSNPIAVQKPLAAEKGKAVAAPAMEESDEEDEEDEEDEDDDES